VPDGQIPAIGLVLNCADPVAVSAFWAPALDYVSVGELGSYVALFPSGRPGPNLLLQRVTEPKVAKNRMHLDIEVPDIQTEAARLVDLGATRVSDGTLSEDEIRSEAHQAVSELQARGVQVVMITGDARQVRCRGR
jgi:hypothetical protein